MLLPPRGMSGAGAVLFWPPMLATIGEGEVTALHRHHASQLIVALSGALRLRCAELGIETLCEGVYVPSHAPHAVDAEGASVVVVFAEPRSDLGRALGRRMPGEEARAVPEELVVLTRGAFGGEPAARGDADALALALPRLLEGLGAPLLEPARVHPGVRRALRHLASSPPPEDRSLAALSRIAGLSSGRFMHAFTEQVGSPLRRYLLWQKLGRAGAMLAEGATPSAAAAAAGFADAAHCARTFRRMFGISPKVAASKGSSPSRGAAARSSRRSP